MSRQCHHGPTTITVATVGSHNDLTPFVAPVSSIPEPTTAQGLYVVTRPDLWAVVSVGCVQYLLARHPSWFNFGGFHAQDSEDATEMAQTIITIDADGNITLDGGAIVGSEIPATPSKAKTPKKKGGPTKKEQKDIISLKQFDARIPDEAAAIAFMEERRWGDGLYCPRCGLDNSYRVKSGKPMPYRCRDCKKYFGVRVGTPLENSNLPVRTWLLAIHFMHTARKGVSALQMHKTLGVDYRTAWFLFHRIREGMRQNLPLMTGVIEVDEAWIGGKGKNLHKSKKPDGWTWKDNKFAVVGLKQQNGNVIAFPVPNTYAETLQNAILDNVRPGSTVYSDGEPAYQVLPGYGYLHDWVSHGAGEYVRDMVTTNGIESFWALLKRGYIGTFHYMSWKHLHRYCTEFSFRHNAGPGNGFETIGGVIKNMEGKRLTYEMLTGKKIGRKR